MTSSDRPKQFTSMASTWDEVRIDVLPMMDHMTRVIVGRVSGGEPLAVDLDRDQVFALAQLLVNAIDPGAGI